MLVPPPAFDWKSLPLHSRLFLNLLAEEFGLLGICVVDFPHQEETESATRIKKDQTTHEKRTILQFF